MNKALFLSTLKSKYKLILICSAALVMYSVIIISMFDPNNADSSKALIEMMPEDFIKALGFEVMDPGLTSFLGTIMYSMPYMIFMIAFSLITANSIIARNVDRGSMACYLSTPVSRTKVALTQGSILILGQVIMASFLTIISIVVSNSMFEGGLLAVNAFIRLNIMGLLLFFVIGAYSFLFSCIFNDDKYSIACSSGLTLGFYVINAIGNMSDDLSWLNNISLFGAFNPAKIISSNYEMMMPAIGFMAVGICLYGLSIYIFNKKDLPL